MEMQAAAANTSCSGRLLLVLRGEAFRLGGHRTRNHTEDVAEQLGGLDTVYDHVAAPAAAQGWQVSLALDVFAPEHLVSVMITHLKKDPERLRPEALRWHLTPTRPSQLASWADTLTWATSEARSTDWAAMLIVRVDLAFKQPLPLPRPCAMGRTILAPFQQSFLFGSHNSYGVPRIADTLLLVPRARNEELARALARASAADSKAVLHDVCNWVGDVGFMVSPGHDADSQKEWNPLYRMLGRPAFTPTTAGEFRNPDVALPKRGRYPKSSPVPSTGCPMRPPLTAGGSHGARRTEPTVAHRHTTPAAPSRPSARRPSERPSRRPSARHEQHVTLAPARTTAPTVPPGQASSAMVRQQHASHHDAEAADPRAVRAEVAQIYECLRQPRLPCTLGAGGTPAHVAACSWRGNSSGADDAGAWLGARVALLGTLVRAMHRSVRVHVPPYAGGVRAPPHTASQQGYAVEGEFHRRLLRSSLRLDGPPSLAACPLSGVPTRCLFYVPFSSVACKFSRASPNVSTARRGNLKSVEQCATVMRDVVSQLPHLGRADGADHFWVGSHDFGIGFSSASDPRLRRNAHCIVNSADVSANGNDFTPSRDVASVPSAGDKQPMPRELPPPSARRLLAFFAGTLRQGTRRHLADGIATWRASASARTAKPIQLVAERMARADYTRALLSSTFCLAPTGHAVWSPRLVEAIMHGCIPVVVADSYWLPFACLLDWRRFAVIVPETRASDTPRLLAALPEARVLEMHGELARVRQHFAYHGAETAEATDAFGLAMLELWFKVQDGPPEVFVAQR